MSRSTRTCELDDAEAARVSPVNHASLSPAPLLIAVGGAETSEFLRQTQLLWDAWPDNRRPAAARCSSPAPTTSASSPSTPIRRAN